MPNAMVILIVSYFILIIVMFVKALKEDGPDEVINPKKIYEETDLNMFGSTIVWLLLLILDPIYFILKFLYWIFHVGRSD